MFDWEVYMHSKLIDSTIKISGLPEERQST